MSDGLEPFRQTASRLANQGDEHGAELLWAAVHALDGSLIRMLEEASRMKASAGDPESAMKCFGLVKSRRVLRVGSPVSPHGSGHGR